MKRSNFGTVLLVVAFLILSIVPMRAQLTPNYIDASSGFLKQYTFVPSAAYTANSGSAVIDVGAYAGGELWIMATAITGTNPTLNVAFNSCATNATTYCVPIASATQFTGAATQRIPVTGFGRYVYVSYTIGGSNTPGYTFSVVGFFKPYPNTATSPVTTNQGTAAGLGGAWPVMPTNGTTAFKDVSQGVGALGAGVQQTGTLSALSAAASNTITQVVANPGAGASIYLRGLLVEKVSGGSATVTLSTGTGTNCGTGTAVLTGPISAPVGRLALEILVPANNALCVTTDAAGTVARVMTN
jgi:hypothetical protein